MPPPLLDTLSDDAEDALVAAAIGGDRAATERLLRSSYNRIYTVCRRICTNRQQAEDATQNALIAIVRGLPGFDRRSRFSTWTHRIASNAAIDELRRARRTRVEGLDPVDGYTTNESGSATRTETSELDSRRVAGSGTLPDPADRAVSTDVQERLAKELAQVEERFRVPMVLRDVAQLDYREISELLDIPPGTVRSRIARGRAALRAALAGTDLDPTVRGADFDQPDDRHDGPAQDPNLLRNQKSSPDVQTERP